MCIALFSLLSVSETTVYADLPDIQNVSVSAESILSWDAFPGAAEYFVGVDGAGGAYTSETSYDLNQLPLRNKQPSGEYRVELMAVDSTVTIISSEWSGTFTYTSPYPQLAAPTNLGWDGNTATWDPVPNADHYSFNLWGRDGELNAFGLLRVEEVDTNSVDISSWMFGEGISTYYYRVSAISDGNYTQSDSSMSLERSVNIELLL